MEEICSQDNSLSPPYIYAHNSFQRFTKCQLIFSFFRTLVLFLWSVFAVLECRLKSRQCQIQKQTIKLSTTHFYWFPFVYARCMCGIEIWLCANIIRNNDPSIRSRKRIIIWLRSNNEDCCFGTANIGVRMAVVVQVA